MEKLEETVEESIDNFRELLDKRGCPELGMVYRTGIVHGLHRSLCCHADPEKNKNEPFLYYKIKNISEPWVVFLVCLANFFLGFIVGIFF